MKHLFLAINIFSVLTLAAQEKGVTPFPQPALQVPHATRAVVVGISDYQSPEIPDLLYADRDAQAFADWLQSPAGGSVPAENIELLTNEKATFARFTAVLDWLIEKSNEGDLAIIYFSGHGDVETKTRNQFGFLLEWDTPPTNYKAGAYSIPYLQDVVSTISIDKKARVVVITDACHAGKLAGSDFGGTQATAQLLGRQFANEVKIMSCQPNEFALEGAQWGGGRGVFSYHLVDGLTGLADKNDDGAVSLFEIGRYLEDHVSAETDPHPQLPMTVGDRQAIISLVDAAALSALQKAKAGQPSQIAATGSRGFADAYLGASDSLTLALYRAFETALANGDLLQSADGRPSANDLYLQLAQKESLKPLYGTMRRNLAVALQDEVQQALNALLADDPYEVNHWNSHPEKYAQYPAYLQRSIELLGEKHYMYASLLCKKRYFEAYLLMKTVVENEARKTVRDSLRAQTKALLLEAAQLDPEAAYVYHALGQLYVNIDPGSTDSLVRYCSKAIELTPNWLLPYLLIAWEYHAIHDDSETSNTWTMKALERKPESYVLLERLAFLRQWQGRYAEADTICLKMLALRPDLFNAWGTMGTTHIWQLDYGNAETYYRKSWELEPGYGNWAWQFYGFLLLNTRRAHEGLAFYQKLLDDPAYDVVEKQVILVWLVLYFIDTGQLDKARDYLGQVRNIQDYDGPNTWADWAEAVIQFKAGKGGAAQNTFEKMITDPNTVEPDGGLRTWLAEIEDRKGDLSKADSLFQEAINHVSLKQRAENRALALQHTHAVYGDFLLRHNRDAEAFAHYTAAVESLPLGYFGHYGLARYAAKKGDKTAALDYLEKALDRWYPRPEPILEEPLFSKIKNTKRFKALMAKHFPPGWENR